jgi:hypothetical protein
MMNRRLQIAMTLILGLLISVPVWAGPRAVITELVFEFKNVPEGQKVSHEYVIKNNGDALLKIVKVSPP